MIEMNKEYQTRDGRAVRILATDVKGTLWPVVGLLAMRSGVEQVKGWTADGRYLDLQDSSSLDLIPVPTKYEGWAVVDPYSTLDELPIQMCRSYEKLVDEMKREGLTVPRFRIAHVTWED